jgi:hypothetical protein
LTANWQIWAILFFSTLGANRLRSQMHTEPLPSPIGDESSQETPAQAQEVLSASTLNHHGGDTAHKTGRNWRVPKRDIVPALEVPFQTGELKVAEGLTLWPALKEELLNFRRKINLKTAHDSYEHWRESDHDDLVLATALACWRATRRRAVLRVVRC